ncbi:hypothetical protein M3661_20190 [Paenibacillus sp. MER 180]|uniref:hypothetical protein n=1 Tax=Paenibacillus sp. MER 180 TaxID=2939570 RepID=UPI00204151A4|nr:hypothetical protein [Paenibacillus sp. MER 180]MCM3292443.1 hypothetical protein [Paenibacillus sp. MER 180]
MLSNDQELAHFLVDAKQRTYAAADNNTSVQPILPGSVQLECRSGDLRISGYFLWPREIVEFTS